MDLNSKQKDKLKEYIDFTNTGLRYEILCLIHQTSFNEVYNYLKKNKGLNQKDLITNFPPLYRKMRENIYRIEIDHLKKKERSVGMYKCIYCGSENTISMDVQTRSADEEQDTFVRCLDCKQKFKD